MTTKGYCCFNHVIGLPKKEAVEKPIFDYEKLLFDCLLDNNYSNNLNHTFKHKHLWVKKATGLGVTEFFLRLMAWLCLINNDYRNSQMCIVTGPNINIAIKLIRSLFVKCALGHLSKPSTHNSFKLVHECMDGIHTRK